MYSTCTFCNQALGTNEVIEHFPVGQRLAFDGEKGRLWVICRRCAGWNLSPLEERWEAIEEAERLYRTTMLRVSTDNIGLARARDGTDLIRIGEPQRPELAAWRYGQQFTRRRRKYLITASVVGLGGAAAMISGLSAGFGVFALWSIGRVTHRFIEGGFPESTVGRVRDDRGSLRKVKRSDLLRTTIGSDKEGGFVVHVNTQDRFFTLKGEEARRAASILFRAVNRRGGTPDDVESAVGRLSRAGSAEQFLADTARRGKKLSRVIDIEPWDVATREDPSESGLIALSTSLSLAVEMALHEQQERRMLEGELAELKRAWQEAEEIGAIADSLLLPAGVDRLLQRLRDGY